MPAVIMTRKRKSSKTAKNRDRAYTDKSNLVRLGVRVKLRFTTDSKDESAIYLIVRHIDIYHNYPQIELNSPLVKAILGAKANSKMPIYYQDNIKGVTGVYVLKVLPPKKEKRS